jgi:hypothetical protein
MSEEIDKMTLENLINDLKTEARKNCPRLKPSEVTVSICPVESDKGLIGFKINFKPEVSPTWESGLTIEV